MSQFFGDSIFWIEVEKIKPNPFQPRKEFDDARLKDLAESIRMYGVLQPLVVTRREVPKEDGGLATEYELISGERRLRASKLAGIREVPAIIRNDTDDGRLKLELAIIENLQREDLNPVDRARAFKQLIEEFKFKHSQVAMKVGKSREYVTNTVRILELPSEMLDAVAEGKIAEGHTRPLLMLASRPEEQATLFKEIIIKKLTVREAELIARNIAVERVRKKDNLNDPVMYDMEQKFSEVLGTRVQIERRNQGGRLHIDFFSEGDLREMLELINKSGIKIQEPPIPVVPAVAPASVAAPMPVTSSPVEMEVPAMDAPVMPEPEPIVAATEPVPMSVEELVLPAMPTADALPSEPELTAPIDDRSAEEKRRDEDDLYSIKNFSL